jgi:hypothetical protein
VRTKERAMQNELIGFAEEYEIKENAVKKTEKRKRNK